MGQLRGLFVAGDEFQKGASLAARIGIELAVSIVVGTLLGFGLDRWLSTRPWLMLIGMLLGTFVGFRNVYRQINEMERNGKKKDGKPPSSF